jgi:hypothetical protein
MADSLIIDWLNENEYRAYPLSEYAIRSVGGFTLANDVIVDARIVTTTYSNVYLISITADASNITFSITDNTFVIPRNSITPFYARLENGNLLVLGPGIADIPNGVYEFEDVKFEFSVVSCINEEFRGVTSITPVGGNTFDGDVEFKEGYQFELTPATQTITFGTDALYGTPIGCNIFDGAPQDCGDIVSYINGISPATANTMYFLPGAGMRVIDDPDNHRIFIGLTFIPEDVCKTIIANPYK